MLERWRGGKDLHWFKNVTAYYARDEWELFDLKYDPEEAFNVAAKPSYSAVADRLKRKLSNWRNRTADPWICAPHAVLEDRGAHKYNPECMPLYN